MNGPIEKPKLDDARTLRGTYFIDSEDGNHKETISRNARKKLEVSDGGSYALRDWNEKALQGVAAVIRENGLRPCRVHMTRDVWRVHPLPLRVTLWPLG